MTMLRLLHCQRGCSVQFKTWHYFAPLSNFLIMFNIKSENSGGAPNCSLYLSFIWASWKPPPSPPRLPSSMYNVNVHHMIIYHIWLVDWQHGWLIAEGWSLPVCSYSKYSTNAVRCFPAFVCYWYKSGTGGAVRGTGGVVSGTGGAVCNFSYWHARTLGCTWLVCHRSLSETVNLHPHYAQGCWHAVITRVGNPPPHTCLLVGINTTPIGNDGVTWLGPI